jgi:hypothetical protein
MPHILSYYVSSVDFTWKRERIRCCKKVTLTTPEHILEYIDKNMPLYTFMAVEIHKQEYFSATTNYIVKPHTFVCEFMENYVSCNV